MVKNLPAIWETPGFDPSLRTIPWRRKWQPTPLFLPGKSLGWRRLVGYSPWGHKESDMTEPLHFHCYVYRSNNVTCWPFRINWSSSTDLAVVKYWFKKKKSISLRNIPGEALKMINLDPCLLWVLFFFFFNILCDWVTSWTSCFLHGTSFLLEKVTDKLVIQTYEAGRHFLKD